MSGRTSKLLRRFTTLKGAQPLRVTKRLYKKLDHRMKGKFRKFAEGQV